MKDGILTTHVNVYEKITNGKYMLLNNAMMYHKLQLQKFEKKMQRCISIEHVNNIPTMQYFIGISRNTQSKFYMLSSGECA